MARLDSPGAFPCHDWFSIVEIEPGVYLISEPVHVNCYLIVGSEAAVLFDTGLGIANIRLVAEALAGKPLRVVNSHYHFDHSGGNRFFDDIAIHRSGVAPLASDPPEGLASTYMAYTRRLVEDWPTYKELDDRHFHLLTAPTMPRPLPEGFDYADYQIVPSHASGILEDGDMIDLGDRQLNVWHTPGHSPDSICLFDGTTGHLFTGDTVSTGPIYAHAPDSDLSAFARSTARLASMGNEVKSVFVAHYLRYENKTRLLSSVAEGFRRIEAGDVNVRPNQDFAGAPVLEACFDEFSVFLPPTWRGDRS